MQCDLFPSDVAVLPSLSGAIFVNHILTVGEPLTFTNFDVTGGRPKPKVIWYKDEVQIRAVNLHNVTVSDVGMYKVVAENEAGSVVHYADVKVNPGNYLMSNSYQRNWTERHRHPTLYIFSNCMHS